MTLEEFLFGKDTSNYMISSNETNTRTYKFDKISDRLLNTIDVRGLIQVLSVYNEQTAGLHSKPREGLYETFYIPKKSGGLRRIDAPKQELMDALRRLKTIFETSFGALYHTSAFAYIKGRSIIDCLKRHQANESKWFGKYDLHNFFGSTTKEFVVHMFSMIFPFSEVIKTENGRKEFETAIDLAFLNGGLPQGTPISPLITNVMMIPVDYELTKGFREMDHQRFIFTRYADDFQVSSRYKFSFMKAQAFISETLTSFGATFSLNVSKTRYGSSAGSNWNLGLMLNKDNEITVGHKRKRQFQAMISSYIMDKKNGVAWDKSDIQTMDGYRNYYRSIEHDAIDGIIKHINQKFGVDVVSMIKQDLRA